jgi:hypothetical protein
MDDGLQIITEETSREDPLRHITALERRLECDRVYVMDETIERSDENPLGFREVRLSPEERVRTIRDGTDGIGCRDIGTAFLEGRHEDPDAYPIGLRTADLLGRVVEAAKAVGYADGFRAARDSLASSRAMAHGVEINLPKEQLVDLLDRSLTRFSPEVAEKGALIERVEAGIARAFARPGLGGRE